MSKQKKFRLEKNVNYGRLLKLDGFGDWEMLLSAYM